MICNSSDNYNKNPDKKPFTSINDSRLDWLQNDFIYYFEDWKSTIESRRKRNGEEFTLQEKNKMILSHATLNGLCFTALSLVNITKEMFSLGAKNVGMRNISQDILESFFGNVRGRGYNKNPTLAEFGERSHAINKIKTLKEYKNAFSNC